MAVLCEAISVVVPTFLLEQRYPDGVAGYADQVPNATFCCDGPLTRVGFMSPVDVEAWVDHLIRSGFEFLDEDEQRFVDVAVVDQIHGFTADCSWLRTDEVAGARWAWLATGEPGERVAPEGWSPEVSMSMTLVTADQADKFELTGDPDALVEAHVDAETGETRYVGRAVPAPET